MPVLGRCSTALSPVLLLITPVSGPSPLPVVGEGGGWRDNTLQLQISTERGVQAVPVLSRKLHSVIGLDYTREGRMEVKLESRHYDGFLLQLCRWTGPIISTALLTYPVTM